MHNSIHLFRHIIHLHLINASITSPVDDTSNSKSALRIGHPGGIPTESTPLPDNHILNSTPVISNGLSTRSGPSSSSYIFHFLLICPQNTVSPLYFSRLRSIIILLMNICSCCPSTILTLLYMRFIGFI